MFVAMTHSSVFCFFLVCVLQMGITSRDQTSPVLLLRNISQHLSGTARTIGTALVGRYGTLSLTKYSVTKLFLAGINLKMNWLLFIPGVRTFRPSNASTAFLYVGGPAVVLSLVAMAPDDSYLYAALKVLLFVLETNSTMEKEMNRIEGYQVCVNTGVPAHCGLLPSAILFCG